MIKSTPIRKSLVYVLTLAMFFSLVPALPASAAGPAPRVVTIDGNGADTNPANTFKGYGAVSANNTSRLLLDYKEEHPQQYWEIMRLLFDQDKGAGINHVKVEMGNDSNTSSGTEPATKRYVDEAANVRRGAGFIFAADAKTINPAVKVSILRWTEPNWVQPWSDGNTDSSLPSTIAAYERMYKWYKDTAVALKETFGMDLDYINPDRNETSTPNVQFIKWFAKKMRADSGFPNYNNIKIVASDENTTLNIPTRMLADPELMQAVDVMAYHYNMATSADYLKVNADNQKEVWYSEGVAPQIPSKYRVNADQPFGGPGSALDVAGRFIGMYTQGKRTHYMFQPAVSAFYSGGQYSTKEIVSAKDPWSGYYAPDVGIQTVMHFTQFAADDWMYIPDASAGVVGNRGNSEMDGNAADAEYNRLVFVSPDKKDFSVVMVNDSDREAVFRYDVKTNLANAGKPLQVWETRAPDGGQAYDANWYQRLGDLAAVASGDSFSYTLTVKPHSMVSITSTTVNPNTGNERSSYERNESIPPQSVLDVDGSASNVLYEDDFEYSGYARVDGLGYIERRGGTPRYTADQGGAFEVEPGVGKDGTAGMKQIIYSGIRPGTWAPTPFSYTLLGDERWANYSASIDFKLDQDPSHTGENYVAIGLRHKLNHTTTDSESGYKFRLYADGSWRLIRLAATVASGKITGFDASKWHRVSIKATGRLITATLDGASAVSYLDSSAGAPLTGQALIQTSLHQTVFDNFKVEAVNGYVPYVTERIDDLDSRIAYVEGSMPWSHSLSGGYARLNRTITTTGASILSSSTTAAEGSLNRWYLVQSEGNASSWGSNSANAWTGENGAYASLTFKGTGIEVYGLGQGTNSVARMDVYLDDFGNGYTHDAAKRVVTGKGFSNGSASQLIYKVSDLEPGVHRVKIVKTGAASGSGNYLSIEKAVVTADSGTQTYLELPFTGTGFHLVGDTAGATLDLFVDNKPVGQDVVIPAATVSRTDTYAYGGLEHGPHTLKLAVKAGTFSLDAIDIMGEVYGSVTTAELAAEVQQAGGYKQEDYMPMEWTAFSEALTAAQGVLAAPADQYAVDTALATLRQAAEALRFKSQPVAVTGGYSAIVATKAGQAVAGLPQTVEVTLADGTTGASASINWLDNTASRFAIPYQSVQVTGEIAGGKNLYITVQAEVVPDGLVYLLDAGVAGDSTPPFAAIKALLGDTLLNDKADQLSTADTMWGHSTISANYKLKGLGGAVVTSDKSQTGVYGSDTRNNPLTYVFPLKAGDYTITSFHRDWWSNGNRTMDISVSYKNDKGETVSEIVRSGLIAGSAGVLVTHSFALPADGSVQYSVNNTFSGNQASVISYVGVAKRGADPADQMAVAAAKGMIEAASYLASEDEAGTEEALGAKLRQTIGGLEGFNATGVTVTELSLTAFQAAAAGVDGSFSFTAALQKGKAEDTASASGTIAANAVPDTTKPIITLIGDATLQVAYGESYTDAGATALDDRDGDLTASITAVVTRGGETVAAVNTNVPGTYMIRYNVKDAAGNQALEVTREVVVSDAPVTNDQQAVSLAKGIIENTVYEVQEASAVTEAAVRAWLTQKVAEIPGLVATGVSLEDIQVNAFTAAAGGVDGSFSFTVALKKGDAEGTGAAAGTIVAATAADTTKPVIVLNGQPTVQVAYGASYTDAGATASDDRDGDITASLAVTITFGGTLVSAVSTSVPGTYTIRYNVSDAAGNAAEEATRTVVVGERIVAPTPAPTSPPAVTPAPTVKPSAAPDPVQTLGEGDLKPGTDGAVTVELLDEKQAARLPGGIADIVGERTLRLHKGQFTVAWPKAALTELQHRLANPKTESIQLALEEIAPQSEAIRHVKLPGESEAISLTAASAVHDFGLYLVSASGGVTAASMTAEPVRMSIAVDPAANADLLGVYRIAADGTLQYIGGTVKDGIIHVKVSEAGQYVVLAYDKAFADVSEQLWASDAIKQMAAKHMIAGRTATAFNPDGKVTRAEFAAMLARALGLEAKQEAGFADVASGSWYADAVAAVAEAGIVFGRSATAFAPNATITREEMAVMMIRAYEYASGQQASGADGASPFSDSGHISAWAQQAAADAQALGLIKGRGGNSFAPQDMMTRAEGAQVMVNLLKRIALQDN